MIEIVKILLLAFGFVLSYAITVKFLRTYIVTKDTPSKIDSLNHDIKNLIAKNINLNTSNESLKEKLLTQNLSINSLNSRIIEQADRILDLIESNDKYREAFSKFSKDIEPLRDDQNDLPTV